MSPVFRHGRLRLYLLKLLDESPRHGYEVIRLLQDRFMGVYAPSPGTIYPRLARLEEEGLVTHDEVDGKKVYRITEKGREELRNRSADLTDLEAEITASVRDIAREVTEDVRETVRNLREELTFAARDMQRRGGPPPGHQDSRPGRDEAWRAREAARRERAAARQARAKARHESGPGPQGDSWAAAADDPADRLGGRAGPARPAAGPAQRRAGPAGRGAGPAGRRTGPGSRRAGPAGRGAQPGRAPRTRARRPSGWRPSRTASASSRTGWVSSRTGSTSSRTSWTRSRTGSTRNAASRTRASAATGRRPARARARAAGRGGRGRGSWDWQSWADWPGRRGWPHGGPPWADPGALPDLEQLARHFTRELRDAAAHAQAVSEEAASDLRVILDDALARIKAEVFGGKTSQPGDDTPPPDQDS